MLESVVRTSALSNHVPSLNESHIFACSSTRRGLTVTSNHSLSVSKSPILHPPEGCGLCERIAPRHRLAEVRLDLLVHDAGGLVRSVVRAVRVHGYLQPHRGRLRFLLFLRGLRNRLRLQRLRQEGLDLTETGFQGRDARLQRIRLGGLRFVLLFVAHVRFLLRLGFGLLLFFGNALAVHHVLPVGTVARVFGLPCAHQLGYDAGNVLTTEALTPAWLLLFL